MNDDRVSAVRVPFFYFHFYFSLTQSHCKHVRRPTSVYVIFDLTFIRFHNSFVHRVRSIFHVRCFLHIIEMDTFVKLVFFAFWKYLFYDLEKNMPLNCDWMWLREFHSSVRIRLCVMSYMKAKWHVICCNAECNF